MYNLNKGDNRLCGEIAGVKVLYNSLAYFGGRAVKRGYRFNRAVGIIAYVIKRGNIYPLDSGGGAQKFAFAPALLFIFLVKVYNLQVNLLALTQKEKVEKVGYRLCVAAAWSARHHKGRKLCAVGGAQRHARKVEHI